MTLPPAPDCADSPFAALESQPADAILAIITQHRADPRDNKIDLGVGVYRDSAGATPVMAAVKAAEARLLQDQTTKSYIGPDGDREYVAALAELVFSPDVAADPRLIGLQTPGGGGALRLAGELLARARPNAKIWMSTPTWPNHPQIFSQAGLTLATYRFVDQSRQAIDFSAMMNDLTGAEPGDVVLLHACCHNPTGMELSMAQWEELGRLCVDRRLIPLVDLAYQGLGRGLGEDAAGLNLLMSVVPDIVVAYSCDKNFALYRERVGALWVRAGDIDAARLARENLLALARANWSMPPDHGAAVVRIVLQSADLRQIWLSELQDMRSRLSALRTALGQAHPALAAIANQTGLFALLPLKPASIAALREEHGIYICMDGRINIAGLNLTDISRFAAALAPHLGDGQ